MWNKIPSLRVFSECSRRIGQTLVFLQPRSPGQIVSPLLKQVAAILNPVVKVAPALTEPLYVMAQVKYLSGEPVRPCGWRGAPGECLQAPCLGCSTCTPSPSITRCAHCPQPPTPLTAHQQGSLPASLSLIACLVCTS